MEFLQKVNEVVFSTAPFDVTLDSDAQKNFCEQLGTWKTGAFPHCESPRDRLRFGIVLCYNLLFNFVEGMLEDHLKYERFSKENKTLKVVSPRSILTVPKLRPPFKQLRGNVFEHTALSVYASEANLHILKNVHCINPSYPFISGSADGVVIEDGEYRRVVEVKVPLRAREEGNIRALVRRGRLGGSYKFRNGELVVAAEIYFQLQMQMLVYNIGEADLILFSPVDQSLYVKRFYREDYFGKEILPRIFNVYKNFINVVCNQMDVE